MFCRCMHLYYVHAHIITRACACACATYLVRMLSICARRTLMCASTRDTGLFWCGRWSRPRVEDTTGGARPRPRQATHASSE